jgi:hypothetical protein
MIYDNEKGICMLIHVAISGDRNVAMKETEKILKYKYLTIEQQHMWNIQIEVKPVITRATGTISKSVRKYQVNRSGKHKIKALWKTAIYGTAHISWEVLM